MKYLGWEIWSDGKGFVANKFGVRRYAKDYESMKARLDLDKIEGEEFYARLFSENKITPTIRAIREMESKIK